MEIESRADIRLAARAMNDNWPVDAETKADVMDQLIEVMKTGDHRDKVAAAKAIMAADALNTKREAIKQRELDAERDRRIQLLGLVERLGIDISDLRPSAGGDAGGAGGSIGEVGRESV